ncbi:radical SAM protein [Ruminococcaceae bacterium OttesenSCG-928-I18]|nr:radical SAM protein [Ruminococcaceae bacterium OttesenSCG-928-I18]
MGSNMSMKENLQAYGIGKALDMIKEDPETGLPKLMDWVDLVAGKGMLDPQRETIRDIIEDKKNPWHKFMISLFEDLDRECLATFFKNFIVSASVIGNARRRKVMDEHGCNAPWAILMDPTSACNLGCTGCWAAEYGDKLSMSFEQLDSIIEQGKEMGTYFYIYSGGEPLVRKKDIIRLCEKHPDCEFLAFTNGTLIDEEFADEMLRVKNFAPAISIEGFEQETDSRRGKGTYQKVVNAMNILKERKLIFGASLCYTSQNTEVIGSEEYFDFLVDSGCKFAWFFTYMPVGVGAPTDLIATAKQREYMYHQVRKFRNNLETAKPMFTLDFWNDGEYINGCIAGGRYYLHINANGDIEPCAFIHYSDSNIKDTTLLEAYKSPLFMQYHDGQPFNDNQLRPCPLLDNEGRLAQMVHDSGAHSTDMTEKEDVDDLCAKCKNACDNWKPVAERLWMEKREKAI